MNEFVSREGVTEGTDDALGKRQLHSTECAIHVKDAEENCSSNLAKSASEGALECAMREVGVDAAPLIPEGLFTTQKIAAKKNVQGFFVDQPRSLSTDSDAGGRRFEIKKRERASSCKRADIIVSTQKKRMRRVGSIDDTLICSMDRRRQSELSGGDVPHRTKGSELHFFYPCTLVNAFSYYSTVFLSTRMSWST